jgi:hypothetical protein
MNSKMIKSEILVLTGKEKTDVVDIDVTMGWMLQPTVRVVVDERERKLM